MELLSTAAIFRYHKELIQIHGNDSPVSLGWDNEEGQMARFQVLVRIGDLNGHSVLDVGCGHGDLRPFLGNIYPNLRYYGVDQIPELLDTAEKKYAMLPETVFFQGNFAQADLPATDYILASGSLNYRHHDPLYVLRIIEKLFQNCRIGFGFNLLSYAEPDRIIVAYKPSFIVEYCRQLTSKVQLIEGYRANDFTIFMYH